MEQPELPDMPAQPPAAVPELELGARVSFPTNAALVRHERLEAVRRYGRGELMATPVLRWMRYREANPYQLTGVQDLTTTMGIIVGIRTKRTGWIDGGGWDDPTVFNPIEVHRVYLVASNLYHNPKPVLREDLVVLHD
jgi:hypothetical protein